MVSAVMTLNKHTQVHTATCKQMQGDETIAMLTLF